MIFAMILQLFSGLASYANVSAEMESPVVNNNEVTFNFEGNGAETSVLVAGDFNDWATEGEKAIQLAKDENNLWTITKQLPYGRYAYKFVVDGNWIADPLNPQTEDDGYGGQRSILNITDPDPKRTVTLVGSLQNELGSSSDWNPGDSHTNLAAMGNGFYQLTGNLPAGTYEYKIAINGSWDENYGANGEASGANILLTLERETNVTFYYHDGTHKIADSSWYQTPPVDRQPRIVGNIQPAINAGNEWNPSNSTALLFDDDFDKIFTYKTIVPNGNYEYKIVLGNNWEETEAYPGSNATLNVKETTAVTFFYNNQTKDVYTDYTPSGTDGKVNSEALYHDTWNKAYRQPFGAIPVGEKVTLRLAAKKGDLTRASTYVKNFQTGNSKVYAMEYAGWMEVENQGQVEFWEVTFTTTDKGVHGYKFIARDMQSTIEYGEDTVEGGLGKVASENAGLFQLTVFDQAFKTPDWMKEAVVYQIFPDRFFNGNTANDSAKNDLGARGLQPIEHKQWTDLPDNPRLASTAGYEGDGEWSNDFFGGDIAGIQAKLDYIESLGVNTIYLNPIAYAASNHKYDASDYKAVDPMFGSAEEFDAFTSELETRGMHLILDGVFNHVGDDSIYFDRYGKYKTVGAYEYWELVYDLMNDNGLSEADAKAKARTDLEANGQVFNDEYGFHNWFNIENEKVDVGTALERYKYQAWWGFDSLPEIKSIQGTTVNYDSELNNKPFADYMMYEEDSVAKSWIAKGGSGWRLDVANEVDMEFWREFRKQLKATSFEGTGSTLQAGESPLILGEIWDDASKYFLGDQYDSVMNYRFERAVMSYLKNGKAEDLQKAFNAIQEDYPKEAYYALMNLMGSHDTPRAIFLLGGGTDSFERAELDPNYNVALGKTRLKLASIMQMGYPGAPTIYYGDEAGVTGSKDPDDRRTYPWGNEDLELLNHYKKIGGVRKANQELFAHGDVNHVYANGDVFAYTRTNHEKAALILTNRGNTDKTVTIKLRDVIQNGVTLTDQLNTTYSVTTNNNEVTLTIPAQSGRMLVTTNSIPAVPEAVTSVNVEEQSKSITLHWSGTSKNYKVYQTNIKGALYKEVGTTSENSLQINNLTNGRTYYFAIASIDANGNESKLIETNAVIPHYNLESAVISSISKLQDSTLDLSESYKITANITIEGATDTELAEGVKAKLLVKKEPESKWNQFEATYLTQNEGANVFQATLKPLEVGQYSYKLVFTTDGRDWKETNVETVTLHPNQEDIEAPAESIRLDTPAQESGQVNLSWSVTNPIANDAYLLTVIRDGELINMIDNPTVTTYRDYEVENGKTYIYQIKIYDKFGNYVGSNTVNVTPDIVMVEVTFKVKAPEYTPLNTALTIPNSVNGWNTGAWEMSRNGAVTPDWEYKVEVQEGTEITYKYVKNGSWDQEGLADHTPTDRNDDDISYYGYGAIGTDMKIVVQNQGNNKMVIQDHILRWIDQPLILTGPTNGSETNQDKVMVTGNAIKEGNLLINGEQVSIQEDMSFSHEVKLDYGDNSIKISIQPSEKNKQEIFKNDGGAIDKNTKRYTVNVFSTHIDDPGEIGVTDAQVTVKEVLEDGKTRVIVTPKLEELKQQLKENKDFHKLTIYIRTKDKLAEAVFTDELIQELFKRNKKSVVQVMTKYATYKVPVETLHQGSLAEEVRGKVEEIAIQLDAKVYSESSDLKPSSDLIDFKIKALSKEKNVRIETLKQKATLTIIGYEELSIDTNSVLFVPTKQPMNASYHRQKATFSSTQTGSYMITKK